MIFYLHDIIQVTTDTVSSGDDDEYLPECNVTKGKTSDVYTLGSTSGVSTPELPVSTPTDLFCTQRVSPDPVSTPTEPFSTQRAPVSQSELSIPGPSIGNHSYR